MNDGTILILGIAAIGMAGVVWSFCRVSGPADDFNERLERSLALGLLKSRNDPRRDDAERQGFVVSDDLEAVALQGFVVIPSFHAAPLTGEGQADHASR